MVMSLVRSLTDRIRRLVLTCYEPEPAFDGFMRRSATQQDARAAATVAVLAAGESKRLFGVDVASRGIQPVFVRVQNRSADSLRLQMVTIDPRYFTPLEAAGVCHYSFVRRLTAFGAMGWVFLPLLAAAPLKLFTAYLANGRMDDFFRGRGFPLGPIAPGDTAEGFVFTTPDLGTKVVPVRLTALHSLEQSFGRVVGGAGAAAPADGAAATDVGAEFVFTLPVPGIAADYLGRDFARLVPPGSVEPCTVPALVRRLEALPPATADAAESRRGDPVNLVVIGEFETLLACFAARWDESETITLTTCWKTAWAFLSGTNYRYSPVSALHLFGREQDIALQRTRHSIDERLHLRLWLTPLELLGRPVWVGQVSRDIGVRFTTRAWNLTTHRIDPNVDESRDYVIEDLTVAGRVAAVGYVEGVGARPRNAPGRNLTGDPYFTDGRRAVILLEARRGVAPVARPATPGGFPA